MPVRARSPAVSPGPLRLRIELARTLVRVEGEIDRVLHHAVLTPEAVHDLHRDLRRLSSGLAVWQQLVGAGQQAGVDEVVRRLRRLARLVGRVRDRDVTATLFAPRARRPGPDAADSAWHEFLGRLREDTHTGRELLRAFLTSERQGGLFDRARGALELAPRADAARGLARILAEERRRRQGRVRKAHRKARRTPTSERLHRLRIRIRQWRHLASLLGVAGAIPTRAPPPTWQRLQARLGRLHDLDVALATIPGELEDSVTARRLQETRHDLRRSVRRSLESIASRPERATARARNGGRL